MSKKIINFFKHHLPELVIFLFASLSRFLRLNFPPNYMFDEVYHAFTAQAMSRGDPRAWEWWNQSPSGFAYEWTHPPLAKEFMVLSIWIFGDTSFAWRFFSAFFGVGIIVLIYLISLKLFKNRTIALLSSLVASLDGLLLVMSRIAMNDIYFLFFSLLAILLLLQDRKFLMGISLGLSVACKWTGIFTVFILGILYIAKIYRSKKKFGEKLKFLFFLTLVPLIVYLTSYVPFFLGRHSPPRENLSNFQTFVELQKQMYWYHTNLKATHPYQSTPTQWVFDLRPVWIFVDYQKNSITNVYTLDNPFIPWFGILAIIYLLLETFKKFRFQNFAVLISYFWFFIPWMRSPRIMFNYHYLPSTVFISIAIGVFLNWILRKKFGKIFVTVYCLVLIVLFAFFYPIWTGIHIPKEFYSHYFWFSSWR